MSHQQSAQIPAGTWLSLSWRMAMFAVALLWPAGNWRWWEAWVVVGLWSLFVAVITAFLSRHDPELLAERMKTSPVQKGQMGWDKALMLLIIVPGLAIYIVPGFDVVRFHWSAPLPLWIQVLAMALHLPGFVMLGWVMRENTYLSGVVKIDVERGHKVITTGPYALVRHPMYTAVIVLIFAVPMALGSRFGLIPAGITAALFVVRTWLEDRALFTQLEGYPEYSERTRYRLIPGVW